MCTQTQMQTQVKRRDFLKGLIALGVSANLSPNLFASEKSGRSQREVTFNELLQRVPRDKSEINIRYLEHTDMGFWNVEVDEFFYSVLFKISFPSGGHIFEHGTFRCHSFMQLCAFFGEERCVGLDNVNYAENPRVLTMDVKNLGCENDMPVAFGWNDVSNWQGSPRAKMASFRYFQRNLLVGGYYMDDALRKIPRDLDLGDFKLVHSARHISLFQRIRKS